MGVRKECWVTTALDTTQCVKALVLAKSLKRGMTSRSLLVLVSHLVSDELWELLQEEFDTCIRLDKKWAKIPGMTGELYAKIFTWSLVKWNKVVFLDPNCFVVKNSDEIFGNKPFAVRNFDDSSVFVAKPSLDIWRKMLEWVRGTTSAKEGKLLTEVFASCEVNPLEEQYNLKVHLVNGLLARNLDEISVIKFEGPHPIEIVCKGEKTAVNGQIETGIMQYWTSNFESGVAQYLAKIENIHLNGLGSYLKKYRNTPQVEGLTPPLEDYNNAVAIVGMSCRFPGANNLDEFWNLLIEGRDAIRHAPPGRWTTETCPSLPEDSKNSQGGFLSCSVDDFDGKFFGVSPMELTFMDPQQRLTLQVAWEALEDAGIDPTSLKDSYTGVYGGAWRTDYREALQDAGLSESEFFRTYLGNSLGVITARISHCLGLTGPSIGTESGCSSSIVALDLACKSLVRHETDLSLACGVNLLIHPFTGKHMNTVLAPDGHCKTFDASADGFGRAEGCGVLVLKRYADAVRDGDRVWALIRGSAVVQEGASRSLGTPTKYCEALAMRLALEDAGVEPKDVSFVETHGTGTPVGDPLEVAAVAEVYSVSREEPLIIGSVKTNIGHTESCSGIAGVIKVALALNHEIIPPHRNFSTLNPLIDLDTIPARIPMAATEWKRDPNGKPRIAGVSSFGITGTDAHAIVQETPHLANARLEVFSAEERPCHIVTLSGKSEEALDDNLKQFRQFIEKTDEELIDVAYTANVGRGHFPFRAAVIGSTKAEIVDNFKNVIKKQAGEEQPKICFLFTGQGSQYPGMAKSLYEHSPVFRMNFEHCDKILNESYGISIREALWGNNSANLGRTIYSQTSIFVVEVCLLKLWESWGVKPDYVLGHSLGEFGAAVASGILSLEDALKLVGERSRLIDSLDGGKMLVMKESAENVATLAKHAFGHTKDGWVDFAAVNSAEQTVVAGTEENVRRLSDFCKNNGIKTTILDATHAFHSRHMDPILPEYRSVASTVTFRPPSCVFVSGMEGRILEEGQVNADYWVRHTRDSVRFLSASKALMEKGVSLFLEVGPQPVLSALTMINSDGVQLDQPIQCLPSIRKQEEDFRTILTTLGKLYVNGMNINWKRYDQFSDVRKVSIPFYPFQHKGYWFDIPDRGPSEFHPLVGKPVSNASSLKLYTNQLELENAKFLVDHAIGNKIIFPGAGFMEMCLVAGHAATQCTETGYFAPMAPITIENFAIESPLGLSEIEATQLQAIVSSEDSGDTRVTIYSKLVLDKETQKWIRHATATFSPYAVETKAEEEERKDTLEAIKARCSQQVVINESYSKLAEFGLKFGPTFQTLKGMWKGEGGEALFEVGVTDDPEKFICHPVISDAMFQSLMFTANPESLKLHVPVSVNKFICFARIENTTTCYINCKADGSEIVSTLYDSNGVLIAQMVGATMMETTVGTIMAALEAQKMSLPTTYEDVWRSQMGHMDKRADNLKIYNPEIFEEDTRQELMRRHGPLDSNDKTYLEKSNKLYGLYILKGFVDLGLTPKVGQTYSVRDFCVEAKVLESLRGFVRFMFDEMRQDGYFQCIDGDRANSIYKCITAFPSMGDVERDTQSLYQEIYSFSPLEVEYVTRAGQKMAVCLTGKESALPILFPEDPNVKANATAYYAESRLCLDSHKFAAEFFPTLFKYTGPTLDETKTTMRILEVGAGTGSFTKPFLPHLTGNPAGYEFTYTDLSPVFFQMGQKVFEGSKIKVNYRILNVEVDPVSQGFIPHHYDMVVANNVIHATKDVSLSIRNLRNLVRENGVLLISESIKPLRATNLTFGLLDAYWGFQDFDLRPHNCEISAEEWGIVMKKNGFPLVSTFEVYQGFFGNIIARASSDSTYLLPDSPLAIENNNNKSAWVLFSDEGQVSKYFIKKLEEQGNQVVQITRSTSNKKIKKDDFNYCIRPNEDEDMEGIFKFMKDSEITLKGVVYLWGMNYTDSDYPSVVRPYLTLCKILLPMDKPKLLVFTKGIVSVGDHDVTFPSASPIWAMTKCLQNEQPNGNCRCVDMDDVDEPSEEYLKEVFSELFQDDSEIYVAYRNHQRQVQRFLPLKFPNTALSFPKTERFHLVLPASNAINDLRFGAIEKIPIGETQVEVRVKSFALNFRDVFAVLKPSAEFETMNTVGIDYSGVITAVGPKVTKYKVGDPVFGSNLDGDALPSHIVTEEDATFNIPESMTFNEAATIPAVASTAVLCLLQVAKLKKEDTILIHTGSGGVGIVAIQIAKYVGATIVTTAGSKRKRAYLRNLGIKHVFHSRNTSYEKDIRKALNGKGVDVVLNSLTSEGFKEASLAVCNEGARFIEMSKLNVWQPEEVKALRPDVDYQIVDLSSTPQDELLALMKPIRELIDQDALSPIPYVRFDAAEIREALTYLQKARHVGKIVCAMPEPDTQASTGNSLVTYMFNDRSSYLITGGLGGIGFEVAKWMAQSGAKHVVLVGRNPPSEKTEEEIKRINSQGKCVVVMQADVGDFEQCKQLLEKIKEELPPLRGIMHAAGVLTDATFENQSWDKYERTFNPKVRGGWNLHKLTLDYRLEHFVMYSSAVASFGALGQSNHASANFFLDSLAHYRNSVGLPATTVNWGQWGQVGVAANLEVIGLRPFSVLQGISALERVMKSQRLQSAVAEADFSIVKQLFPSSKRYLEELKLNQTEAIKDLQINNEQFWNDYDAATDDAGRLEVVKRFVRMMIRQILKLDKDEALNDDENFQDLGMDSLMMIEMKNVVQSTIGKRATITVNSVKDCHTVNELASRLTQLLSGESEVPPPTREELQKLIREDCELPESYVPASIPACLPSEIKTVLITGATGNMGPYLLRDLTQRAQIEKVYCLIREDKSTSIEQKLENVLQAKNILSETSMEKIECVEGYITRAKLGMSDEKYEELCSKVDCVVHLAVKSNLTDLYKKIEKGESDIRTINVKGTLNVLDFVCATKTKVLFHASTIAANARMDAQLSLSESWPSVDEFDEMPNSAYPVSKFVCDRLMATAVERGIPVKVFRFPAVGGDSRNGANVDYDNNQLMLRMMSYLYMGAIPALPLPFFVLPVDVCSELSLKVFFDDSTKYDLYNVYNPYAHNETELVLIGDDLGFRVDILEPEAFREKLGSLEDSVLIHFLKEAAGNSDAESRFVNEMPALLQAWSRNPERAFVSRKLTEIIPDYPKKIENTLSVIKRDLSYAQSSGVFERYGIVSKK